MERIKININKYKKKNTKLCTTLWQEFAKQTCQDFGVIPPYNKIVFKHAKNNLAFLKAQVTNLQEGASYKGDDIKTYGKLLIYKLTKNI